MDPDSDYEIVPESLPTLLSTNPTEPRMPLPPANKQYSDSDSDSDSDETGTRTRGNRRGRGRKRAWGPG
ncbi:hypothetical protein N7516_011471 [Penicillium verrucosum]|uniref:uncharacterized protein n=1 Tax=Penicillium verrucosum TaxID=60171 RepID=UPI0025458C83|nr:uncharacterized protein N7516_011471 [Penicillium verrucosum]KAJ5920613.1 hypothetical protein N7516_011471 [Penicillium verrucosum]